MKKSTKIIFFILSGCVLLLSCIWIYFQKSLEQIDQEEYGKNAVYKNHYVLIADEANSVLWDSIYESAREEAAASDAYLELLSIDDNEGYDLADCVRIAIASQVDGIILRPDGSEEVRELMNEAVTDGIPVVTILEDDSDSQRISFVGLNSYQMGDAYAEQALRFLNEDTTDIMVLVDSLSKSSARNLIYSQIVKSVDQKKADGQTVQVSAYTIENEADFESEEAIRDLFVNSETLPDIIICMDEIMTECVYQALIDYNKVGDINIIGYYYSDMVLDAVSKGTIPATIALDTEEIGTYSISALEEYRKLGHASDYYSVGLHVITQDNITQFSQTET
jgi:ribose transport system substrate-binding protein